MRIALTTGLLHVPPTYFALQHGERLLAEHEVRMFALAADVSDPSVRIPVRSSVPEVGPWLARVAVAMATEPAAAALQARRLRALAPDIVHQHFATWSRGAIDGAKRLGAPLIATLHGYDVFAATSVSRSPLQRFHRRTVTRTAAEADRLLAVSRYLADRALAAGAPQGRLEVHYQGIDTDIFTPGNGPDELPTLVFIGGLARRKGIEDAISSSIALAERVPHRLRIIGVGPLEETVRQAARSHSHIEVLGSIPRDRVLTVLRGARALILPTQRVGGWREAAGLVLLEAQACGVPVVAYRSGGTPEMVDNGATGILVDEFDREALTRETENILRLGDSEWHDMSRSARDFVVAERSLTSSVTALLEHYRSLGA